MRQLLQKLRIRLNLKSFRSRAFSSEVETVRVKKTRQTNNLEPRFDSIETEMALDDVEAGGVQLRLEDPGQGDRVMGIEGDDRVSMAVIMWCVQGSLHVGKYRRCTSGQCCADYSQH